MTSSIWFTPSDRKGGRVIGVSFLKKRILLVLGALNFISQVLDMYPACKDPGLKPLQCL